MDAEEKFDENHLKPNEIIIGPFYTTYGLPGMYVDDKSIRLTTIEFHKKWNERGWNPHVMVVLFGMIMSSVYL